MTAPPLKFVPERFEIILRGRLSDVRQRSNIVPNSLPHLLASMLSGTGYTEESLRAFSITIDVNEDMDQGDD